MKTYMRLIVMFGILFGILMFFSSCDRVELADFGESIPSEQNELFLGKWHTHTWHTDRTELNEEGVSYFMSEEVEWGTFQNYLFMQPYGVSGNNAAYRFERFRNDSILFLYRLNNHDEDTLAMYRNPPIGSRGYPGFKFPSRQ